MTITIDNATIVLDEATAERLRADAARHGQEVADFVRSLLVQRGGETGLTAAEEETFFADFEPLNPADPATRATAIAAIQEGLEASEAGRVVSAATVFAAVRSK